jgi:hypothetical protein
MKQSDIIEILNHSRTANAKKNITGILLYKDGNFMQVLEGDSLDVDELLQRISKDKRHTGLITLRRTIINNRTFGEWKMGFKDIQNLTDDERSAHSDFLDNPLNDKTFVSDPSKAFRLLESFKTVVR